MNRPNLLPIGEVDRVWRGSPRAPIAERLWQRVGVTDAGCWEWTGSLILSGYGRIRVGGRRRMTHRVAYELLVGPIPDGLVIDHLCRNILCCNPDHLEPVTQRLNTRRGVSPAAVNAAKVTCLKGHVFDAENTAITRKGTRRCRACAREWARQAWARRTVRAVGAAS